MSVDRTYINHAAGLPLAAMNTGVVARQSPQSGTKKSIGAAKLHRLINRQRLQTHSLALLEAAQQRSADLTSLAPSPEDAVTIEPSRAWSWLPPAYMRLLTLAREIGCGR